MSFGGGKAPTPDPKIAESALKQAELGEQWLNFSKDAFKISNERLAEIDELTKQVSAKQLQIAQDNTAYTRDATDRTLGIARDQADYVRGVADRQLEQAEEAYGLGKQVSQQQLERSQWESDVARADRQRYEDVYRPVEDQFIEEASNYGSPERQAEAAAAAMADVQTSAAAARSAAQREAASMGVNPNSGRFAGINRAGELGTALATAGAANTARTQVRDKGLALKGQVANLGRGVSADAMNTAAQATGTGSAAVGALNSAAGVGISAGNSAVANTGAAAELGIGAENAGIVNTGAANASEMAAHGLGLANQQSNLGLYQNSTGIMGSGYSGAAAGHGNAASTLQGLYQGQLNAYNSKQNAAAQNASGIFGALGTVAGALPWAMIFASSEEFKEDKEPIADGEALEAVNQMPVERWRYKEGIADEGEHIGPYAEDFQEATGQGDGQGIAAQDAIGLTMKAVQDLDQKVDQIAEAVGLGGAAAPPRAATAVARPAPPPRRRATATQPAPRAQQPLPIDQAPGLGMRRAA